MTEEAAEEAIPAMECDGEQSDTDPDSSHGSRSRSPPPRPATKPPVRCTVRSAKHNVWNRGLESRVGPLGGTGPSVALLKIVEYLIAWKWSKLLGVGWDGHRCFTQDTSTHKFSCTF